MPVAVPRSSGSARVIPPGEGDAAMAVFKKKVKVSRIVLFAAIPVIIAALVLTGFFKIGRASCRERVCEAV